eukprot:m.4199 g.4199  ORF g.4199 m.4199 type:complete len:572 (-) comp2920_c0_seq1:85-1800(-)
MAATVAPHTVPINSFYGPIFASVTWTNGMMGNVDIDVSALAYDEGGNQKDVCFYKQPAALNGAIVSSGDAAQGQGQQGSEGISIFLERVPPEIKFIFLVVNARNGVNTLAEAGIGLNLADGSQPNGKHIATAPLNMPTEGVLAAVLIRGPPYMYPPSWQMQVTSGFPQAHGPGRDFNEAIPLVEEYLRSSVPPQLLNNRPPDNPMERFDLSKGHQYLLDPHVTNIAVGLGWQSKCDLDVHCVVLDSWFQVLDNVARHRLRGTGIRHSGNDTNGLGRPDVPDETIHVNLPDLNEKAKYVMFMINIAQGEEYKTWETVTTPEGKTEQREVTKRRPRPLSFSEIPGCFLTIQDTNNGNWLTNPFYLSNDGLVGVTRLMAVLTQYAPGRWTMAPLGAASPADPTSSHRFARELLIEHMRPDLTRPVTIDFGVICGKDLAAMDRGGTSDPFFSCKFFDHTTKKTEKIKKTLNPEWNCPKLYTWTGPQKDLLERLEAKLDVYDYDMIRNDFMGRAYLHLGEVLGTRGRGPQQRWLKLGPKHDEAHGNTKMLDGLLGNTSSKIKGDILVTWDTRSTSQ